MKKNGGYFFAGLVVMLLLAAGCSKGGTISEDPPGGGSNPTDVTAPVVEIYTPLAGQVFMNGNSINVTGRVTDDYGLYRGNIRITNDANGALLKEQQYEIHGILSYNFNISYTTAVTVASDYTITVNFEDHGTNTVSRSVKVKVNP